MRPVAVPAVALTLFFTGEKWGSVLTNGTCTVGLLFSRAAAPPEASASFGLASSPGDTPGTSEAPADRNVDEEDRAEPDASEAGISTAFEAHRSRVTQETRSRRRSAGMGKQLALRVTLPVLAAVLVVLSLRLMRSEHGDAGTVTGRREDKSGVAQHQQGGAASRDPSLVKKAGVAAAVALLVLRLLSKWRTPTDVFPTEEQSYFTSILSEFSSRLGVPPEKQDVALEAIKGVGVTAAAAIALAGIRGLVARGPSKTKESAKSSRDAIPQAPASDARPLVVLRDEQRVKLERMMAALYPGELEDLVSEVRETLQDPEVSGDVLARIEDYLEATLKSTNVAERAFRVSRLVTILEKARLRKLFDEVMAAEESARDELKAGQQPLLPDSLKKRLLDGLRDVQERVKEAGRLALIAYQTSSPAKKTAAEACITAERYALTYRVRATYEILTSLERLSQEEKTPLDLSEELNAMEKFDQSTKEHGAKVADSMFLVDLLVSLFDFRKEIEESLMTFYV